MTTSRDSRENLKAPFSCFKYIKILTTEELPKVNNRKEHTLYLVQQPGVVSFPIDLAIAVKWPEPYRHLVAKGKAYDCVVIESADEEKVLLTEVAEFEKSADLDLEKCCQFLNQHYLEAIKIQVFFGSDFSIAYRALTEIFNDQDSLPGYSNFRRLTVLLTQFSVAKNADLENALLTEIARAIRQLTENARLTREKEVKKWGLRLGCAFAATTPGTIAAIAIGTTVNPLPAIGVGTALGLFGFWGGHQVGKAISQQDTSIAVADHFTTLSCSKQVADTIKLLG